MLLHIYAVHAWPDSAKAPRFTENGESEGEGSSRSKSHRPQASLSRLNGLNGHVRSNSEHQRIHDAEAFELQGLISDEEDEDKTAGGEGHSMGPRRVGDEENSPLVGKETSR